MREKIMQLLDEKVDEVFLEMQNHLNIQDGGVFPLHELELSNRKEQLAIIIEKVLNIQQR